MSISSRLIAKIEAEDPTKKLAVLIDADNTQAAVIEGILSEIARFGKTKEMLIYSVLSFPRRRESS